MASELIALPELRLPTTGIGQRSLIG